MKNKWKSKKGTPLRRGWYLTRTDNGFVSWRAWGCGAWWKQINGGWIEWFDGNGEAMRYEYDASSRKPIKLNSDQLPAIP